MLNLSRFFTIISNQLDRSGQNMKLGVIFQFVFYQIWIEIDLFQAYSKMDI